MTKKSNNTTTGSTRLFEISDHFRDRHGDYEYVERYLCRASKASLQEAIREILRDISDDEDIDIVWTFENQNATKDRCCVDSDYRELSISAREVESLEDLYIADYS